MTNKTQLIAKWLFAILFLVCTVSACVSRGPATRYYSLFIDASNTGPTNSGTLKGRASLGIGPVILPGYLQRPEIVSRVPGSQQLDMSAYHAWAEPLEESIARVMALSMAHERRDIKTSIFPWDSRDRPQQQLRLEVIHLDGVHGEGVEARIRWVLFNLQTKQTAYSDTVEITVEVEGDNYSAYVTALNTAILKASQQIASQL